MVTTALQATPIKRRRMAQAALQLLCRVLCLSEHQRIPMPHWSVSNAHPTHPPVSNVHPTHPQCGRRRAELCCYSNSNSNSTPRQITPHSRAHAPRTRMHTRTHTHARTRTRKQGVPSKRHRTVSIAMLPHADCVATLESCVLWQARIITGAGGKVIVDTSGPALLPALETAPFGWKPNRAELEDFLGGTALLTLSDQLASTNKQPTNQPTP